MTEKLYTGDVVIAARVHVKHAFTVNGVLTQLLNEHNHNNDRRDVKLAELFTIVKERAIKNLATPGNIMSDSTVGLTVSVRAQIVEKNLKRTIQRARVRNEAAPANPRNCRELDIPDTFKEIILDEARGAELFPQYDSGAEEHRI